MVTTLFGTAGALLLGVIVRTDVSHPYGGVMLVWPGRKSPSVCGPNKWRECNAKLAPTRVLAKQENRESSRVLLRDLIGQHGWPAAEDFPECHAGSIRFAVLTLAASYFLSA
jgi:hypothetical protein